MIAARLPAFACILVVTAAALAHEAMATEELPARANPVLRVVAPGVPQLPSVASARPSRSGAPLDVEATEDWAEPSRLLLVFAAMFGFLAYRRRSIE